MIETGIIILAIVIIGVNVGTTVSTRFRRWVYKKDTK
jgi:Flp pilus assembly pilin Flp